MVTFKEIEKTSKIIKPIKKAGLSLAVIFSKEDLIKYNLKYNDEIDLSDAVIINK